MARHSKTNQDLIAATGVSKSDLLRGTERWECWVVEYRILTSAIQQHILVFGRECRWQDIEDAASFMSSLKIEDQTIVVRDSARSIRSDLARVRQRFNSSKVLTSSQFLFSAVSNALAPSDAGETDPYFIEPSVLFPDQVEPGPALSRLDSWLRAQGEGGCSVAVVLAPAGVGKTTLAAQLFRLLVNKRRNETVPLLLKREQWEGLASRGAVHLRDIWTQAITACYPRSLLGGENLETYLAAGAIRPIFDGLDELCSGLPGDFSPTELIEDLADTFDEGRLIVTSRTDYWEENVSRGVRNRVLELELRPFSATQRDKYLQKRFPQDPAKRSAALGLLDRVSGRLPGGTSGQRGAAAAEEERAQSSRLDVMPYAVMLAAESVDGDLSNAYHLLDGQEPITGLLLALCERERIRQRLSLDARSQFQLLELLAIEFGHSFTEEELELVAAEVAPGMAKRELERFEHHALLRRGPIRFRFRYDFVQEYLAARAIREWLMGESEEGDPGERALRACAERPAALIERWIDLSRGYDEAQMADALNQHWFRHRGDPVKAAGLSHLALSFARFRSQAASDRSHGTAWLLTALGTPAGELKGLRIRGTIAGLDLSGVNFVGCNFADTEWTKCVLANDTKFTDCVFDGRLSAEGAIGFGLAEFSGCEMSAYAASAIQRARNDGSIPLINEGQIVEAVRETLRLFNVGSMGFNPVNAPKLERHVQAYTFGGKLMRALVKEGVIAKGNKAHSGNTERYEVSDSYAARQFLNDAVRLGSVGAVVRSLRERLVR